MKDGEQVDHALEYLHLCHDIETGGSGEQMARRDLSKDEVLVKEAALTCLLHYFVSDPEKGESESETVPEKEEGKRAGPKVGI